MSSRVLARCSRFGVLFQLKARIDRHVDLASNSSGAGSGGGAEVAFQTVQSSVIDGVSL